MVKEAKIIGFVTREVYLQFEMFTNTLKELREYGTLCEEFVAGKRTKTAPDLSCLIIRFPMNKCATDKFCKFVRIPNILVKIRSEQDEEIVVTLGMRHILSLR